ncbi:hypothetical protein [Ascidiimonas sp. W6]
MDTLKKSIEYLRGKQAIRLLTAKIIGGTETDERRAEKNQFKI